MIDPKAMVSTPDAVQRDIREFAERMEEEAVDLKQLGIVGRSKEEILEELRRIYINEET